MKGLYLCAYDLEDKGNGVSKKINSQIEVFRNNGIKIIPMDINFCEYKNNASFIYKIQNFIDSLKGINSNVFLDLLKKAKCVVISDRIDFIYIRKGMLDIHQLRLIQEIKNIDNKLLVILEIPTFPYAQEIPWYKFFVKRNESLILNSLYKYVDRIVTYSKDNEIFNIKTLNISNGCSLDEVIINKTNRKGINLLAVAFFAKWHGYDRILKGMIKDIELVKQYDINFYLVGEGNILKKYKSIVQKNNLGEFVHFCGVLKGDDLQCIYNKCDIGIDTLARHRVGVYYNSTLKGKEYMANGLPIISGVETELDNLDDFMYYYRVSADDTPISIRKVIDFYNKVYLHKDKNEVAKFISNYTSNHFSNNLVFEPVIKYINNCKNNL